MTGQTDSQGRHPCLVCGRKFTLDRISTHENVCRRRLAAGAISVKTEEPSSQSLAPNKKGATVMTLASMNRPKSKQMKAMPSLQHKQSLPRKQPEIKAFSGAGVRLGAYEEPEETKS